MQSVGNDVITEIKERPRDAGANSREAPVTIAVPNLTCVPASVVRASLDISYSPLLKFWTKLQIL
jgi:hypothetical protein